MHFNKIGGPGKERVSVILSSSLFQLRHVILNHTKILLSLRGLRAPFIVLDCHSRHGLSSSENKACPTSALSRCGVEFLT